MEIVNRQTILKYLNITLLSYSRICYFSSFKEPQRKIKVRFLHVGSRGIQLRLNEVPASVEGNLVFYSYTFIFRFKTNLSPDSQVGISTCDIPPMIETFDRRKYARLKFESRENKVVTIHNKTLNTSFQGILTDISAGGIGFAVVDTRYIPKVGDVIMTKVQLKEKPFQSLAQVVQVRDDHVGCTYLEKSVKFQLELNAIIKKEIDWRSETMLRNLRKREELVQSFKLAQEKTSKAKKQIIEKLNNINSLTDFFIKGFEEVSGIVFNADKIEYKENTVLEALTSLSFDIHYYNNLLFRGYLFTQEETIYKLAPPLFDNNLAGRGINTGIVLEQLSQKLSDHSESEGDSKELFTLSHFKLVQSSKHLLSQLLKIPCIHIQFKSTVGDIIVILMADNLEDSLDICCKAHEREFITMERMDLIEPISYSALKVFSEFLNLEIREKSVTHREQLLPRFEISVLLDIFFDEFEGKVVLNLSKRLALKIYEILLEEPAEEFNNEVKDAIAEITNMITGNAKSEYENHGIYYKLATPMVVESREGVTIYAMNMKFLSSVYWTSEGFFDLNFCFYKK